MKLHQIINRLLLIMLILAPLAWLTLSDDGRRHTGLFILKLKGEPAITLDVTALDSSLTEQRLQSLLPEAAFSCEPQQSPFGNRVCVATIGGFNGILAHYISFFYADQRLQAMKLVHRGHHQKFMLSQLAARLGEPNEVRWQLEGGETVLWSWPTGSGDLLLQKSGPEETQPSLLWLLRAG